MARRENRILPEERVGPTSRRSLAVTIAAGLISAIALNQAAAGFLHGHPGLDNRTYRSFHEQWRRLVKLDAPFETLIIGDSSGRHGVDPQVLDEALGTRSVNFCTIGNAAVINPAWQLETYLAHEPPPRRVILIAVHDLWYRDIDLTLIPRIPLHWGFWSNMRAAWPLDLRDQRDIFLARYVPLISQDKTVCELAMYPWRTRDHRLTFTPRGFVKIPRADPAEAELDRANHLRYTVARGWHISTQSRRSLAAMRSMADEYGFDLYIANAPLVEGLLDDPGFAAYYAAGQDTLAAIAAADPRVHLVLDPPVQYPPSRMQNADHVAVDGAADFTRKLAAAVAACEH